MSDIAICLSFTAQWEEEAGSTPLAEEGSAKMEVLKQCGSKPPYAHVSTGAKGSHLLLHNDGTRCGNNGNTHTALDLQVLRYFCLAHVSEDLLHPLFLLLLGNLPILQQAQEKGVVVGSVKIAPHIKALLLDCELALTQICALLGVCQRLQTTYAGKVWLMVNFYVGTGKTPSLSQGPLAESRFQKKRNAVLLRVSNITGSQIFWFFFFQKQPMPLVTWPSAQLSNFFPALHTSPALSKTSRLFLTFCA